MGQLQRVVQDHHGAASLDLDGILALLSGGQLLLPHLVQVLELVAAIAEGAHSVYVERVLALTHRRLFELLTCHMDLLVGFTTIVL